ncbi:MAG: hypothetical protein ACLQU4_06840 [Limisphaerales bacterium]
MKRLADFEIGGAAIGDEVGQAARLDLLQLTAARAGIGAARQPQNGQRDAQHSDRDDVYFHALKPAPPSDGLPRN